MLKGQDQSNTIKYNCSVATSIADESDIGAGRRKAIALAKNSGFSQIAIDKIAIIVNELGNNLFKHADPSKIRMLLFQLIQAEGKTTFEIMALDKGPGITNLTKCLQDGYTTTHTSGTGLGAVSRLANLFKIYSLPTQGTIVLAHVYTTVIENNISSASFINIAGICLPIKGEEVSGDAWSVHQTASRCIIMLADGLGHGPEAAIASNLAGEIFQKNAHLPLVEIMNIINSALQRTRGAAVALTEINKSQQIVKFVGLGNISGNIFFDKKMHHMVSSNGTAGVQQPRVREYNYPWSDQALLFMHSDGMISHWTLNSYPGLSTRHPALIAEMLYRDFCRGNDDVTVVVARNKNSINSLDE